MERLSAILESCPCPAEPERSSASLWSVRQQKASDRWEEARPYHLRCLLESEAVGKPLCCFCYTPAVIRCRECLPEHPHVSQEERLEYMPHMSKSAAIYRMLSHFNSLFFWTDRILPTMQAQHCTCQVPSFTLSAGKPVILITINGRYDLHLPRYVCQTCLQQWAPDVRDLVRSGYWPASANVSTIYTVDLLNSFQDLKLISPGFSRQAFAKLLEHRTLCAGRVSMILAILFTMLTNIISKLCSYTLTISKMFFHILIYFLVWTDQRGCPAEFAYASFEKDQLCCDTPFTCPACTPEMVAVSADGNRKLYRYGHTGRSTETPFFDGLFLAKDSEVSDFVNTIQTAVKNIQGRGTCGDSQWAAARETSRRASKLDEEGVEVGVCRHGFLLKALNMYRGEIFAYPMYLQKELLPSKAQFFAMDVACKYWPYLQKVASVIPALKSLTEMKPFLRTMHARAHATKCELTVDKKRLLQEIEKYNSLVADLSKRIDVALVDHSLAGQSTDTIWPWEDYGSGMHFSMLLKCHAWPGSTHDLRILMQSGLRQLFERHHVPVGCHLLGDSGYPCKTWLLTPYLNPQPGAQLKYNIAHKNTRNVVERGIGQMKRRFHVLHGEVHLSPERASTVITVCAILHNRLLFKVLKCWRYAHWIIVCRVLLIASLI
ncbi:putative nuclease HARBI1 [Merluccius polli]|uniref:Nuclease HARBI1 n=1 Tax=Merluccius polli TaxID=89951 RepID=A0AA47NZB0_MERPO|nr:putative nuclease HARBI1 [Merluccius polli]